MITEYNTKDEFLAYATSNPDLFEWMDENGNAYSQPYYKGSFDLMRSNENARDVAQKILNRTTQVTENNFDDGEACLSSLKHFLIVEDLVSGMTRPDCAKKHGLSLHGINKVLYSKTARNTIAQLLHTANKRLAQNLELATDVAANALMELMTKGTAKDRLSAIEKTMKWSFALNGIYGNSAKVSQTRTVKGDNGITDKVTVTGKLDTVVGDSLVG